jgi:DNA-binding response OmpR family regulator
MIVLLAQNPDKVFSNEELFSTIWGIESLGDVRTVMVHISNIRKKIEENPRNPVFIQTVKGVGYRFIGT